MKEAFERIINNIADLLKVKTLLSLSVVITTCLLTFKGVISTESFMAIAGSVVTYYFTKFKDDEKVNKNDDSK